MTLFQNKDEEEEEVNYLKGEVEHYKGLRDQCRDVGKKLKAENEELKAECARLQEENDVIALRLKEHTNKRKNRDDEE